MSTLVDSSEKTLLQLSKLREMVKDQNPSLIYKEVKYWASFKNAETNRNIVFLHPTKNQIRLFTKIDYNENNLLKSTPATQKWADSYPSIFTIRNEEMIITAVKFIVESYSIDLSIKLSNLFLVPKLLLGNAIGIKALL